MTKAIVIEYLVFKDNEEQNKGTTTIFGRKTYNKLLIWGLNELRCRYQGCNVYASKVNILK